ncbi:MAG TPA: DinB family protein [Anaerolineae bacterium]|nr:DinB family protein [Anaerolineae bacterium]
MKPNELLEHSRSVRGELLTTARKFSDRELGYCPFPNRHSVGQLLLHIAHEEEIEVRYGITREWSEVPPEFSTKEYATLGAIERVLTETHARTKVFLSTLDDAAMERVIETRWGATAPLDRSSYLQYPRRTRH